MDRKMFEAGVNKTHGEALKMDKDRDELLANMAAQKEKLAEIEGKPEKAEQKNQDIEQLKKNWEDFYRDIKIEADLSQVEIPEKREGFEKLIIMAKGLTPQKLFDKLKELCPAWKYTDDNLDKIITSDRSTKEKAYAFWVRDRVEADEEHKNKSANDIKKEKIIAETLEERLLQEIEFFKKTGGHLDVKNVTLCAGSRISDGLVPGVYFHSGSGKVSVHWYDPDDHDDNLRVREAVCAEGAK